MKTDKEKTKERLDRLLLSLVGTEDLVEKWWSNPNRAFDFRNPKDIFDTNPEIVINYIHSQFSR